MQPRQKAPSKVRLHFSFDSGCAQDVIKASLSIKRPALKQLVKKRLGLFYLGKNDSEPMEEKEPCIM